MQAISTLSLKEAKMTFLIPERITFLSSSLGFKDAVYKFQVPTWLGNSQD